MEVGGVARRSLDTFHEGLDVPVEKVSPRGAVSTTR